MDTSSAETNEIEPISFLDMPKNFYESMTVMDFAKAASHEKGIHYGFYVQLHENDDRPEWKNMSYAANNENKLDGIYHNKQWYPIAPKIITDILMGEFLLCFAHFSLNKLEIFHMSKDEYKDCLKDPELSSMSIRARKELGLRFQKMGTELREKGYKFIAELIRVLDIVDANMLREVPDNIGNNVTQHKVIDIDINLDFLCKPLFSS